MQPTNQPEIEMTNSKSIQMLFTVVSFVLWNASCGVSKADIVTDWTGFSSETASGSLGDVEITGFSIAGAPFSNLATGAFSGSKWSTDLQLSPDAEAIILQPVNAGADHRFEFSGPMSSVLFYVSNFDSSSDAILTAEGAVSIEMIAGTSTMFYDAVSGSSGRLYTSNDGFDGFADAVLRLSGDVQSVRMQYSNGVQNNGIGYTFVAVPEPGSMACGLPAILFFVCRRRRANTSL